MYRVLPAHTSLDHLRKQAKERLRHLQQRKPDTQLAEAQHAIAREYGFASWPKLKARVESRSVCSDGALNAIQSQALDSSSSDERTKVNPLVGNWSANVSKSRRHPLHQFRSVNLQFSVVGDAVTIADRVVDESGREERHNTTVYADGKEHEFGGVYVVVATWLDANVLQAVSKKDGEILGQIVYELSAEGNTLTLSGKAANETDFSQVVVFERDLKLADVGQPFG